MWCTRQQGSLVTTLLVLSVICYYYKYFVNAEIVAHLDETLEIRDHLCQNPQMNLKQKIHILRF